MRAVALLLAGCAATPAPPDTPRPDPPPEAAGPPAPPAEVVSDAPAAPSPSPPSSAPDPAPAQPVDAADPPGVSPLTEAEREEVERRCQRVAEHARRIARADRAKGPLRGYLEAVKADPPAIADEDVPRCLDLMLRAAVALEAGDAESLAINRLRTMIVGLAGAFARDQKLCPSAPPVPVKLASLEGAPVRVEGPAWEAPGWTCLGFDLHQAPQRFQYEVKTDPEAGTYELIARGYVVPDQPPVELVLAGEVEDGAIQPHSNVMRRAVR